MATEPHGKIFIVFIPCISVWFRGYSIIDEKHLQCTEIDNPQLTSGGIGKYPGVKNAAYFI
jgi:hypothetical protein